jgi:hypothetical protein
MGDEEHGETKIGLGVFQSPTLSSNLEFSIREHAWVPIAQHAYVFENQTEICTYEQCIHCRCVRHRLAGYAPNYTIEGTWTKEEPPCDDVNSIPIDLMGELTKIGERW